MRIVKCSDFYVFGACNGGVCLPVGNRRFTTFAGNAVGTENEHVTKDRGLL